MENQRYFLLFILYTLVAGIYNLVSIIGIWNHYKFKQNSNFMTVIVYFDAVVVFYLTFYNLWCWFLACVGITQAEYFGENKVSTYEYSFNRIRDNLFKVFGTKSYFQLLSPSLRYNAFNGIEWSY